MKTALSNELNDLSEEHLAMVLDYVLGIKAQYNQEQTADLLGEAPESTRYTSIIL